MVRSDTKQEIVPPKDFIPFVKEVVNNSIVHRFESICIAHPDRIALKSEDEVITYNQLNEMANLLARAIIDRCGTTPQPIPFMIEHGPSSIITLLGILKAGHSYVALDPTYPIERLEAIINSINSGLVITNNRNLTFFDNQLTKLTGIDVLNLDSIDKKNSVDNLELSISPDAIAYIVFTSGSTGTPKGVMRTHRNALHDTYHQTNSQKISPSDRYALFLSVSYEASRSALMGSLLNGAALYLFDPRRYGLHLLPDWLEREQISILLSTPSAFRHLFDGVPGSKIFQKVRLVSLGGEPSTSRDAQVFQQHFSKKCYLLNSLGSSEAGVLSRYVFTKDIPLNSHIIPVGYPVPDKTILLVNEDGKNIEDNQVGEILVKSHYLSPGYWNQPSLTQEKFSSDLENKDLRIYHTGDLGRWQSNGCLEYLGRIDSQVKIRGYRVEIEEIEAVLNQHPAVRDACLIAWTEKDSPEEKTLVAYVVPDKSQPLDKRALRTHLGKKLPDYMVPGKFIFLDKLPLTLTGKINHLALPPPEKAESIKERLYIAPRDNIESKLVGIWERVLKIKPVGIQDDFFELGGNSLLAAQIFTQIEKTFGKRIPLATLFQAASVEQQANFIRQEDWVPDWSSLVALRPGDSKPPLFFAAPVGGNVLSYRDLMMRLDYDQPCYGLQAVGLDGVQTPMRSVPEVAEHYIKEILTVQPEGPYYLSGSSFGGLVAYEMAQRLFDMGKSIALVVMFDAYGPNYPKRLPSTSRLRRRIFKYLRRADTHVSNFLYTDWKGRWIYLTVKVPKLYLRISRNLRNKIDRIIHPVPQKLRKVRSAQMGAARREKRYMREMRRFSGRLVLFRAEKQPLGIYPDLKLGWGAVVGDDIEIYEIPGHHTSIIYEPRVDVLAEIFNQVLAEVQDSQSTIKK